MYIRLLLISSLLLCLLPACVDGRRESFYPTLADADRDGATTRGWVPDFLPRSSRAIHELHDLSPSIEWCAFEFDPADSEEFRSKLTKPDALPPAIKHIPKIRKPWWPLLLRGEIRPEEVHRAGMDLYVMERAETAVTRRVWLLAIDRNNGKGFFYTTRAE